MKEIFAISSVVLVCVGQPPYIIDMIKGKTKPERMTWFIFSVLGIIAFVSQTDLGASWSLLFSGVETAVSLLTFGLSLKFGVGGHTKLDIFALTIAMVGVLVALVAHQPLISLLGVILADLMGTMLTVRKVYQRPGTETVISWLLAGIDSALGAMAVGRVDFKLILYPAYLSIASFAVLAAQHLGHRHAGRIDP